MPKAKILVIYTGGTIGMTRKSPVHPLKPAPLGAVLDKVPNLKELEEHFDIGKYEFDPLLDSSNINPDHWIEIADVIDEHYDQYMGFVVLHGTDTMAYTASGLAFILQNLDKPVVITGSQLPIDDPRTDAVGNLVNSIMLAGYKARKLPRIPEVILVFASRILRGCRATKISSKEWLGFDSPNCAPIGEIGEHIRVFRNRIRLGSATDEKPDLVVNRNICKDVAIERVYPGLTSKRLRKILADSKMRGVVLETFGAGNAPSNPSFLEAIKDMHAAGKGVTFLNVTQCVDGLVEMGLYEASAGLLDYMISGVDMTTEAAYAKLIVYLNRLPREEDKRRELHRSLRGEQSQSVCEVRFEGAGMDGAATEFQLPPAFPAGYQRETLEQASIRLTGVGIKGLAKGEEADLRVFINMPEATVETSTANLQHAFTLKVEADIEPVILAEITDTIFTMVKTNDAISVKIILSKGELWFRECIVSLFQREAV